MPDDYLVAAIALKPLLSEGSQIEPGTEFQTTQQRLDSFITIGAAKPAEATGKQDSPTPVDAPAEPKLTGKPKKAIPKYLGIEADANSNSDPASTLGDQPAL